MTDLDEIEKACAEATPGPWRVATTPMDEVCGIWDAELRDVVVLEERPHLADAAFMASARSWVPALVAELRATRAEVERLRTEFGSCDGCGGRWDEGHGPSCSVGRAALAPPTTGDGKGHP